MAGRQMNGGPQVNRLAIGVPDLGGSHTNDQLIPGELYTNATKTPEYIIKIDDYMSMTTGGYEQYAPLYHFYLHASRETNPNVAQEKKDSGRVIFQNPELIIPTGKYMPDLIKIMLNAKDILQINIIRLGNIGEQVNAKLEEYNFENCEIQEWKLIDADTCSIRLRATTFEVIIHSYDQTGAAVGDSQMKFDLKTGQTL